MSMEDQQVAGPSNDDTYSIYVLRNGDSSEVVRKPDTKDWTDTNLSAEDMINEINGLIEYAKVVKLIYKEFVRTNARAKMLVFRKNLESLSNEIIEKFIIMFERYPVNINDLQTFLNFQFTYEESITKNQYALLLTMTRRHEDGNLYLLAANFVHTEQSDVPYARRIYNYGIKHHNSNKELYLEYYKMELKMIEKTKGFSYPIATRVYKMIINAFENDMHLHIKLLEMALKTDICQLQISIIKDMIEKYYKEEIMWKKLATINFEGFIYDNAEATLEYDANNDLKKRILASFQIYENALNINNDTVKINNLWKLYAQSIVEIWTKLDAINEEVASLLNNYVNKVFLSAHTKKLLGSEYYVYWAEFSTNDCEQVLLENAIKLNSQNANVWTIVMNHYLKLKLFETANRVLRHSVQALKSKSLPLWKTISGIFLKLDDQKWIEDLYTRGIASVYTEISVTFRIPYLNWCYKKKGRSMARKLFQNIKDLQPGQPELFLYMISLEKSCNRLKNDVYINKLYFELCTKFGSHRMDIWYHAIKYNHEENNENDVARLCTTADSILPQHLKDELKDKLKIIARKPPLKIKVASPTILI